MDIEVILKDPAFAIGFCLTVVLAMTTAVLWMRQSTQMMATDPVDPQPLVPNHSLLPAAPYPVIVQNHRGQVVWQNENSKQFDPASWPKDVPTHDKISPTLRASLLRPDGTESWFRFEKIAVEKNWVTFAIPADGEMKAEKTRRDFVQTLSKTFAQLSIGLAIFDRNRQLFLFNPALLDLTKTSFDALSQRPSLASFLDILRLHGVAPEIKDFGSWREKVSQLEADAVAGSYSESWSMASGQTFKMTGRPHPDGAIALLIEDISEEVGSSRQFHREILCLKDSINQVDLAFIVFSSEGCVRVSNQAYCDLWGHKDPTAVENETVFSLSSIWEKAMQPEPLWGEIRDYVTGQDIRTVWNDRIIGPNGVWIDVRVSPLRNKRTLVEFATAPAMQSLRNNVVQKLNSA